ncbi:LuxR C-terminal-related transcriptional regulator, partial [Cohnella sp. WQ 127256]|uniref:helix-turn-helix transcriptional regulator n=1 Tax=Cohnella sp. WQ 127256 TaxID=2938790 RepID=UPI0021175AAA
SAEGDWAYAHVVELPQPISMYRSDLEDPLQAIVMKLLAKSPAARYQTAYGLLADLKLCTSQLEKHGKLLSIGIGQIDQCSQFQQPSNPIGREYVLHELETAYEQAAQGSSVRVKVSGEEGAGKSFLMTHFVRTLISRGEQVMTVVCRDGEQTPPYAPILQVIGQGFEQIWCEDAETIATVTSYLERELGRDVAHIHSLLPETAVLLGLASNGTTPSPLNESQTKEALLVVLRSFMTYCKPLVLWIDDLDRADPGTLDVINSLLQQQFKSGILLIETQGMVIELSNRNSTDNSSDAEVSTGYTKQIKLEPFVYDDVRQWMIATVHEDSTRVRVLARWVYDLTTGNPSAIRKLLQQWIAQKKLVFDELQQRWTWDQVLNEMLHEPNSQTQRLYEEGLHRLDERTQQLLVIASVCGMRFSSSIINDVCGSSHSLTLSLLASAESEGLIYRDDEEVVGDEQGRDYLFMHTQLQIMLYKLLEGSYEQWHYKIGLIYKNRLAVASPEDVVRATYHWNRCLDQLSTEDQRVLAQFNTQMCVRMNKQRKYLDAKAYAETAISLMEQLGEPITIRYRCYTELAYSEYMRGNMDQMRAHFQYLMQYADQLGREERVNLAISKTEMFVFKNNAEAIRNGQIVLAEYDWFLPKRASMWTLLSEVVRTQLVLRRSRDELSKLPSNTDADYELLNRLLLILSVPLLSERPIEQIVLSARFIRYGLKLGMNEFFLCNIGLYELILQRGAPWLYRLLPTEALQMLQSTTAALEVHQYRLPLIYAMSIQHRSPREATNYLMKSMRRSMEYGDVTMANLSIIVVLLTYYDSVHGLMELISYIELEAQHMIDEKTLEVLKSTKSYCEALQDESLQMHYITPASHSGQREEDNYTCICKLEVAYYAGQYRDALDWARRGKAIELKFDWMQNRKLRLFEALSGAALYPKVTLGEQRDIVRMLRKLKRHMKKWSGYWGYQSSSYLLILAEWKRIAGKGQEAVRMYEAAIAKAKEEQYPLMEAIAGERLYDYYVQSGSPSGAVVSLMDACTAYFKWGLIAKVNAVKQQYPDLWWYTSSSQEQSQSQNPLPSELQTGTLSGEVNHGVHPGTEVHILSQIARWTDIGSDDLLEQFLDTAIRQLGADRGCILKCEGEQFQVHVQAGGQALADELEFPLYLCRYVRMSGRPVLLEDASTSRYMRDPYIARFIPASIVCMRIGKPYEGADWLLYIENAQVSGVFTEQSLHVLELMITRLTYLYWIQHDQTMDLAKRPTPVETPFKLEPADKLIESLTQRETEVLQALAAGFSNKEIAESLGISHDTVKKHISNLYGKLGVKRRGQAIARAKELNLI